MEISQVISREVMEKATGNRGHGKEMMMLLLGRSDTAVKIIRRAVISVAQLFDKELMALVLDQKGAEESITDEALGAMTTNHKYGKGIIMLLLERGGGAVKIAKRLVISVAQLFDKELMALILDREGAEKSITDEALEATTTNRKYGKEIIMLLLELSNTAVRVTEQLLEKISSVFDDVMMLLSRLIRHGS